MDSYYQLTQLIPVEGESATACDVVTFENNLLDVLPKICLLDREDKEEKEVGPELPLSAGSTHYT